MRYLLSFFLLVLLVFNCSNKSDSSKKDYKYTNDLIHETSPYLLQHAHNPVDWKAWNPETLALAKKENKLIVISVGYAACHWCHVMEHESFENDSVAKIMNAKFINIKVDREERPDIDQVYMHAVQLMTGSGGWPLNCIALPDGRPIFGGTYFEKEQWIKILKDVSDLYENDPDKAIAYAEQLTQGIKETDLIALNKNPEPFTNSAIVESVETWKANFDTINGGITGSPKFPLPNNLSFLWRHGIQNKDQALQNYVSTTLTKMAYGGIYDQIGGGFSRYSVDETWHIPHFEKMLYDNAQLVSVYSNAYLVTQNQLYKQIVEETLQCVERDFLDESGAFYSALDADSENAKGSLEEGAFYVWNEAELKAALKADFEAFKTYYNINKIGFWEHDNYVLYRTKSDTEVSEILNVSEAALQEKLKNWKLTLLKERSKRKPPRIDNKALTSWNALMLKAYTDAYRVFKKPHYLEMAIKNAQFIKDKQLREGGGLNRVYINKESSINGYSEDYAATIEAFISLYQVTLDEAWLTSAKDLMHYTLEHFYDEGTGMFYFTSNLDTSLISRKMETVDGVIPSSNATLAKNLFTLGLYYYNDDFGKKAKQMLSNVTEDALQYPSSYSQWLDLMQNYTKPFYEVAISGSEAKQHLYEFQTNYLPNVIYAAATSESNVPLLESKNVPGKTYIFVCTNGSCKAPQTEVSKAIQLIKY
ncbi:thioredoxin domain-containing protein [Tamlana sp. I1]|uniref:thioredoxin domain-containing protein n=1 Tax=Tamlana sp. I1 TaxID=2762061 RepID=UPI00293BDA88|nr:thioredoxin domain-containing protein [Tamlana sp. I1]